MEFGCCTTINNYELLLKNGYGRIILPATDVAAMDLPSFERLQQTLETGAVKCEALNSFCTPNLRLCGPDYDEQFVLSYIQVLADRAARIGIRYIGIGAPKSRSIPADFPRETAVSQFVRSLDIVCKECAPYNMSILLEPVCSLECNFITTTDEAREIIESLEIDNLQLVFDTYHAFMMGEDDQPLKRAMPYICLVHMAQDIKGQRHYLRRNKMNDYRIYMNALLDGGYDGEVSVEAFYDDMEEQLQETLEIMQGLSAPQSDKWR